MLKKSERAPGGGTPLPTKGNHIHPGNPAGTPILQRTFGEYIPIAQNPLPSKGNLPGFAYSQTTGAQRTKDEQNVCRNSSYPYDSTAHRRFLF